MAAQTQDVTTTPAAIASLTNDTVYRIQNVGSAKVKYLRAAAADTPTEAADGDKAFVLRLGSAGVVKNTTAERWWVWCETGASVISYDEQTI